MRKGPGKGREQRTGRGKGRQPRTGSGQGGKGKGNGKGKGIVKRTSAGVDISHAIASQLQKEMSEAESDTEG